MAERLKQRSGTLGFAVPVPHNQWLGTAFVFVEESERLAYYGSFPTSFETTRAVVLGHLIAHEVGHLLLGPDSHSRRGIMSFPWSKRVLKRIGTAHLAFTEKEAQQIRARLVQRIDFAPARVSSRAQQVQSGSKPSK